MVTEVEAVAVDLEGAGVAARRRLEVMSKAQENGEEARALRMREVRVGLAMHACSLRVPEEPSAAMVAAARAAVVVVVSAETGEVATVVSVSAGAFLLVAEGTRKQTEQQDPER